ncbi:DUF6768 family protein [Algisphaera agarilytica]|uniref:Uncharacterized protein n=1 Tax=Algisphaera agarilytica TaxID=1385975 RepID=A0A7X0LK72_9BACT|nr:DUF6768 family protein [Algisphaera agarilytica]MBB6429617.1 hypothetical protein [Algisphaera agarilytica]
MNDLDDLLKESLGSDTADVVIPRDTLREEIGGAFMGWSRPLLVMVLFDTVLAGIMFVVSVVNMFRADDLRMTVIWATSALFFGLATGFIKLYFYMRSNRNRVLREVKRLELGVAVLSEHVRKA